MGSEAHHRPGDPLGGGPASSLDKTPNHHHHPTTCGKVERFQDTIKRWLRARPKASATTELQTQLVRTDRISDGKVTLRVDGQLHHIGLGRTLDGTRVILLIDGYDIRVIHAATGEIIRTLTINPEHRYHGTGRPTGGPKGPRKIRRTEP